MPKRADKTGSKPKAGKRYALNMRTTFEVRRMLEDAARASGRSLAQEAEFRIERSMTDQHLLVEALELTYGRGLAGILLLLGEAMKTTGQHAGFQATGTLDGAQEWWDNPYAFSQTAAATEAILNALTPPGEPLPPPAMTGNVAGLDLRQIAESFGLLAASTLLKEVASDEPATTTAMERAPRLRGALGERLVKRIKGREGQP